MSINQLVDGLERDSHIDPIFFTQARERAHRRQAPQMDLSYDGTLLKYLVLFYNVTVFVSVLYNVEYTLTFRLEVFQSSDLEFTLSLKRRRLQVWYL